MTKEKKSLPKKHNDDAEKKGRRSKSDRQIDEELDQTFPASDPPSYSKPGNDKKEIYLLY